ncbi:MAG: NADH-quinone oxidoreductase subunit D, partial [Dehalococcoidia bacterium]
MGAIDSKTAIDYGMSGPNLRATGVPIDLRRTEPYLVYPEFKFDIPVGQNG